MHYIRLALQAVSAEVFVVNDVDLLANNFCNLCFSEHLHLFMLIAHCIFSVTGNVFKGIFMQVDVFLPAASRRILEIFAGIH
jgi:hypothetical protein